MRAWIKAALVAALTAWLLMAGIDFIETHLHVMKWVQLDTIEYHDRLMRTLSGGK